MPALGRLRGSSCHGCPRVSSTSAGYATAIGRTTTAVLSDHPRLRSRRPRVTKSIFRPRAIRFRCMRLIAIARNHARYPSSRLPILVPRQRAAIALSRRTVQPVRHSREGRSKCVAARDLLVAFCQRPTSLVCLVRLGDEAFVMEAMLLDLNFKEFQCLLGISQPRLRVGHSWELQATSGSEDACRKYEFTVLNTHRR